MRIATTFALTAILAIGIAGPAPGTRAESRASYVDGDLELRDAGLSVTPELPGGNNAEAWAHLAHDALTRFDYRGALELLDRASITYPESPVLLAEYGSVYLKAEEPERALEFLDRAVRLDPESPAAMLGEAEAYLLERDYLAVQDLLKRLFSHPHPNKSVSIAHVLLSRLCMETGKQAQAETEAIKALEAEPENAGALYMLAFIRAAERKPNSVRELARRAVKSDPYLAGARRLLSQYLNGWSGYEQRVDGAALEHFEKGKGLETIGDADQAASEFEFASKIRPDYYRALVALAAVRLGQRDYNRALMAASRAVDADPEGAIANLEFAYAQFGLSERARMEIGATDYSTCFYDAGSPRAKSSLLRLFFPDYDRLSDRNRFVLARSVGPLGCFLPRLISAGARQYMLRLDQSPAERPGFKEWRNRTTFDGRYYASIRGVSGRIALSGIECLDEASQGGFNAIAHEFAHQVQEVAMTPEELKAVRRLYETAKTEGRTLDFYAATNEFEYFAVGCEAFVARFKRPGAGLTARHTREELKARDPGLYMLLTNLSDRSVEAHNLDR